MSCGFLGMKICVRYHPIAMNGAARFVSMGVLGEIALVPVGHGEWYEPVGNFVLREPFYSSQVVEYVRFSIVGLFLL